MMCGKNIFYSNPMRDRNKTQIDSHENLTHMTLFHEYYTDSMEKQKGRPPFLFMAYIL